MMDGFGMKTTASLDEIVSLEERRNQHDGFTSEQERKQDEQRLEREKAQAEA